jgi:hypothetical protein
MESLKNRLLSKIEMIPEHSCWEWVAGKNEHGYGLLWYGNKMSKAHRLSYEVFVKKIDKNLFILHKCDNPGCIRPEHLYEGTQKDNVNDMVKRKRHYRATHNTSKTHCPRGHEYNSLNTRIYHRKRTCMICIRIREKEYKTKMNKILGK